MPAGCRGIDHRFTGTKKKRWDSKTENYCRPCGFAYSKTVIRCPCCGMMLATKTFGDKRTERSKKRMRAWEHYNRHPDRYPEPASIDRLNFNKASEKAKAGSVETVTIVCENDRE